MAEEAVKKQIEEIPVSDGLSIFSPGLSRYFKDKISCPRCHHEIETDKKGDVKHKYCGNCGQALSGHCKIIYY